jgi:hypothetical protein
MNLSLEGLKEQVSNLSLYDIKAGVRKVQNGTQFPWSWQYSRMTLTDYETAVMNYTEMEAKVREATNNEPWGASSTRTFHAKTSVLWPVLIVISYARNRKWNVQLVRNVTR